MVYRSDLPCGLCSHGFVGVVKSAALRDYFARFEIVEGRPFSSDGTGWGRQDFATFYTKKSLSPWTGPTKLTPYRPQALLRRNDQ